MFNTSGLMKRIKELEDMAPCEVYIYAAKTDGALVEARVKDVINEDGTFKDGFCGVGDEHGHIVARGNDLKDVDRILKSVTYWPVIDGNDGLTIENDDV